MKVSTTVRPEHLGRIVAVQALYSIEIADTPGGTAVSMAAAMAEQDHSPAVPASIEFGQRLVEEVQRQREHIDGLLGAAGTQWRVDRMSKLDLQILRLGVAELLNPSASRPTAVVIDESIELAREFGGESSTGFVNGVLDAVARKLVAEQTEREEQDR